MAALGFEMLTQAPAASDLSPAQISAAKSSAATATAMAAARRVAALYAANHTDAPHAKRYSRSLMPRSRTGSTLSLLEPKVDSTIDSLLNFMDLVNE